MQNYYVTYACARKSYCDSYAAREGGVVRWHNGCWEVRVYKED